MSDRPIVLSCVQLGKAYAEGEAQHVVLQNISLELRAGEAMAVIGPSGCGKSTLLNCLAGLDSMDAGHVELCGVNPHAQGERACARLRAEMLGFVYQHHYLIGELTVEDNVALPRVLLGDAWSEARALAREILKKVKIAPALFSSDIAVLSGGQLQRVAIARALVNRPKILFADEPTGNLDQETAGSIRDLFMQMVDELGMALVVVTHDLHWQKRMEKQLVLDQLPWLKT